MRQLLWTGVLGVFAAGQLAATRVGSWLEPYLSGSSAWAVGLLRAVVVIGFYWWSQRWLLAARVGWRELFPGAVAVGVLTAGFMVITRLVIAGQITWQVHAYGVVGAVLVLAMWLMMLSVLIYAGVLVGAVWARPRA